MRLINVQSVKFTARQKCPLLNLAILTGMILATTDGQLRKDLGSTGSGSPAPIADLRSNLSNVYPNSYL
jgi:hypothetical protein